MTKDHELTPDQLEAVSGGLIAGLMAIAFATGFGVSMGALGTDSTPTNITNMVMAIMNGQGGFKG